MYASLAANTIMDLQILRTQGFLQPRQVSACSQDIGSFAVRIAIVRKADFVACVSLFCKGAVLDVERLR